MCAEFVSTSSSFAQASYASFQLTSWGRTRFFLGALSYKRFCVHARPKLTQLLTGWWYFQSAPIYQCLRIEVDRWLVICPAPSHHSEKYLPFWLGRCQLFGRGATKFPYRLYQDWIPIAAKIKAVLLFLSLFSPTFPCLSAFTWLVPVLIGHLKIKKADGGMRHQSQMRCRALT